MLRRTWARHERYRPFPLTIRILFPIPIVLQVTRRGFGNTVTTDSAGSDIKLPASSPSRLLMPQRQHSNPWGAIHITDLGQPMHQPAIHTIEFEPRKLTNNIPIILE